uniref:Uncharacterized protein n=1 Tax=Vibrio tasmaniensis TaxID=212663 RepID=A0A0H3ZV03_9VIBR|nr:hypothetical protein [Vibrio tasmaniensis]
MLRELFIKHFQNNVLKRSKKHGQIVVLRTTTPLYHGIFPRHSGSFLTHRIFRIPEINGGSLAYSTICPKAFPKNNQFPDKSALGRLYFLNAHRALEQINNN